MWNQTSKEQILDVTSVQFTIFIKSSQYCSKCNPNLASKGKKYSKSKTVLQYSNKKKVPERPQPLTHTFESHSQHVHTRERELRTTETQTPVWATASENAGRNRTRSIPSWLFLHGDWSQEARRAEAKHNGAVLQPRRSRVLPQSRIFYNQLSHEKLTKKTSDFWLKTGISNSC